MKATSKDLRYKTKAILKAVDAGKKVVITHRGKPRAVITGVADERSGGLVDPEGALGMWADRKDMDDVAAYVRQLRKPRHS